VLGWRWAPDSKRVVFLGAMDSSNLRELYCVRADGTELAKLNGPLTGGPFRDGEFFITGIRSVGAWAPDSSRIVYTASQETRDGLEVYVVRPDGTGRVRLDAGYGGTWSPDGSRVLYVGTSASGSDVRIAFPDRPGGVSVDPARTVGPIQWAPL
jgi:Tol biopolymer transport system component